MNEGGVPILAARSLLVRFGAMVALDIPELAINQGEVVAIMGPNGAGKSTLLLSLALLQRPTSGEIRIDGKAIAWGRDLLRWRRRMAVVFQEPLLLDTTVQENVVVGLRLRGEKKAEIERRVRFWLERFGIAHLARRQARSLSGGEAQRTSLARAFALTPEILFLDEPFAALDPPTRANVIKDLREILSETGVTALLITHDRTEALALGDRIGVLIGGRLRQVGKPEEVFSFPLDAEVAAFVGMETVAQGMVVSQLEGIAGVEVGCCLLEAVSALPVGSRVLVCLRPEDVTLARSAAEEQLTSARNTLRGTVTRLIPLGAQARVVVDCGFPLAAVVTSRSAVALGLAAGESVCVSFKASAVHLIKH